MNKSREDEKVAHFLSSSYFMQTKLHAYSVEETFLSMISVATTKKQQIPLFSSSQIFYFTTDFYFATDVLDKSVLSRLTFNRRILTFSSLSFLWVFRESLERVPLLYLKSESSSSQNIFPECMLSSSWLKTPRDTSCMFLFDSCSRYTLASSSSFTAHLLNLKSRKKKKMPGFPLELLSELVLQKTNSHPLFFAQSDFFRVSETFLSQVFWCIAWE